MKKLYFMLAAMVFAVAGYLSPQVMASKTVYFVNNFNWSTPKIYTYGGGDKNGSWSGKEMDATGMTYNNHKVFKKTFEDGDNYVIFNDGGGNQTANEVSIVDGGLYYWANTNNKGNKIAAITNWSYDAWTFVYRVGGNEVEIPFGDSNKITGFDKFKGLDSNTNKATYYFYVKYGNTKYGHNTDWINPDASASSKTLTAGAGNVYYYFKGTNGSSKSYDITWNPTTHVISFTETQSDPVVTITDYWLRGNFSGWGTADAYKFTPDAKGEEYTLRVNNGKVLCDNEFKVGAAGDDNWESYTNRNKNMEVNTTYSGLFNEQYSDNMKLKAGAVPDNTPVTVIFNKKNKTIIFKMDQVVTNSWKFVYRIGGNEIELPFDDNNQITGFDKFKNLTSVNQTSTYYFYVKYGSTKYGVTNGNWINGDNHTSEPLIANGSNVNYNFQGNNGKSKSYTINWNPSTHTISFVAEADYAYDTFYFNMTNNIDNKTNVKEVKLLLMADAVTSTPAWQDADARTMEVCENTRGALIYKYKLNETELGKYKNAAVRIIHGNNDAAWYICRAKDNHSLTSDEGVKNGWKHMDDGGNHNNNWLKYVYVAAGENLAAQSYITYEEWHKRLLENKNTVYFTGEGVDGLSWHPEYENLVSEDGVDGVIYWTNKTSGDILFKISWLKPYDQWIKSAKSGGDIDSQRAWATFNMGIIAFDTEKGKGYSETDGSSIAGNRVVKLNKILPYSRKSAENWMIKSSDGAADGTKVLVLDSHSECQTVTLLTFEPNPQLNVEAGSIVNTALTPGDAAKLHDVQEAESHVFHGEKTNGLAHITSLNTLSATATLVAKYAELTTNGANMTVKYDFYANGDVIYTTKGEDPNNELFNFANIAVGDGSTVGARGLYYDKDTKCQFHSKFANGTLSGDFKAASPEVVIDKKGYAVLDENPETLSAMFTAKVQMPSHTDMADKPVIYPDFEVKVNDYSSNNYHLSAPEKANGGEIVHSNHAVAKQYTWFDKVDYTPATSASGYDHDTHNWTAKLGADNAAWPFYLPDVLKLANEENKAWCGESGDMKTTLDFTAYAVYPFLIDRKATVAVTTKSNAPRRAPANLDFSDAHDYHIVLVRMPASTTVELDENSPLTGIDDIVAPEADAEAVYYTLDGRLAGSNPAAGVYIRRVGNKAEKIYIR